MKNNSKTNLAALALAPGIHLLNRDQESIQVGLNPRTSLVLPKAMLAILKKCDGYTSIEQLKKLAQLNLLDPESAQETLNLMVDQGLLRKVDPQVESLSSNQLSHYLDSSRSVGFEAEKINQRATKRLAIVGGCRLGATISLLLGNSGFSNLRVLDSSPVTLNDISPWGASRLDVGLRRDFVIQTMLERIHRGQLKAMRTKESRVKPDLIIYAPDPVSEIPWLDPNLANWAMELDVPYLVASSSPTESFVSSVLTPGKSGCIRCYHQHQTDRDPIWPKLIAQLVGKVFPDFTPTDLVLETGLFAYQQICEWFNESEPNSNTWWKLTTTNHRAKFEIPPHSECGCIWQLSNEKAI